MVGIAQAARYKLPAVYSRRYSLDGPDLPRSSRLGRLSGVREGRDRALDLAGVPQVDAPISSCRGIPAENKAGLGKTAPASAGFSPAPYPCPRAPCRPVILLDRCGSHMPAPWPLRRGNCQEALLAASSFRIHLIQT